MGNKLFVGGLAWATTDQSLRTAFEAFGEVADARVITDRETGRSRGFGFVTMSDPEGAKKAMAMDGAELDGRNVRVNEAQERGRGGGRPPPRSGGPSGPPRGPRTGPPRTGYPPVERRGGSGGGGGGGYGGSSGGGGGGSTTSPDDAGKPAGRKRHNGGGTRKRGGKGEREEAFDGGSGGGRRKRRGGGNRREFDDYQGDY